MSIRRRSLALAAVALQAAWAPLAAQANPDPLAALQRAMRELPPGFLDLENVSIITGSDGVTLVTAKTTLLQAKTDVLFSTSRGSGARAGRSFTLALRPDEWSLSKSIPQLANPALDGLTLDNVALVVTEDSIKRSSAELTAQERAFFREIFQVDDFEVNLRPGINLLAGIPAAELPEGHPLLFVMDALGIEKGVVFLQGTIGKSLTMLARPGSGGLDIIKDLYLRAELPPMRPPNSPAWFRSGQLALELTGFPSVAVVGEMNVIIDDEELMFFLKAALAKTGMSLSGGLAADTAWVGPFGIEWMTLKKTVLKIGISPTGSLQLGFAGDLVIGEKDIAVAIAVAVNLATGVPTNFIFDGESEAGFGMSDLVSLQQQMAAARDAAAAAAGSDGGGSGTRIPIDALPQIEFRKVGLKFAPRPDADLGVTAGMAIKGRLLLPLSADGALTDFAGVDIGVGEEGIWVRGDLGAFTLGPLVWGDALIDLTATAEEQHFRIAGDATLFNTRQKIDLELARTHFRFHTITELFGLFGVQLDAEAAFDLQNPKFLVQAIAESDLADVIGPVVQGGAVQFARAGAAVLETSETALVGLQGALTQAEATGAQLRVVYEQQLAVAQAAAATARSRATAASHSVASARSARDRAYRAWMGTSIRQVSLRAARRSAYLRAMRTYTARAAAYSAAAAGLAAAQRIVDAMPPVDQSIAVLAADRATAAIRTQLETSVAKLQALQAQYAGVIDAVERGGTILTIDRAAARADLEALMRGDAVQWQLAGTFTNTPYDIVETISFADIGAAGAQLLNALLNR